jgi:membrane protease YdiL (CAAX protease family)
LHVQNAFDPITSEVLSLVHWSTGAYLALTLFVGVALFFVVSALGLGRTFSWPKIALRLVEATAYAVAMAFVAGFVASEVLSITRPGAVGAVVLSCGAGFYEELAFRAALFGGGLWLFSKLRWRLPALLWALFCAAIFSAVHYTGSMGDRFALSSFLFRMTAGLVLTLIFRARGFACAVWTHALYDIGVTAF